MSDNGIISAGPEIYFDPSFQKIDKRHRGDHSTQCKNPNPIPQNTISLEKRPRFVQELVKNSRERDITQSDVIVYSRHVSGHLRKFYRDGANAFRSLMTVIAEHVNLVTWQSEISLRRASDLAGLSTISDAEKQKHEQSVEALKANDGPEYGEIYKPKVNISRASRSFAKAVELGVIVAPREWQTYDNKYQNGWTDKVFEVTSLFFEMMGITAERAEKQRSKHLAFLKHEAKLSGLSAEQVSNMSVSQIRAERRLLYRRLAWERRMRNTEAKKAQRQVKLKNRAEVRVQAQNNVLKNLSPNEVKSISAHEFKVLLNKEVARLLRLATPPNSH